MSRSPGAQRQPASGEGEPDAQRANGRMREPREREYEKESERHSQSRNRVRVRLGKPMLAHHANQWLRIRETNACASGVTADACFESGENLVGSNGAH